MEHDRNDKKGASRWVITGPSASGKTTLVKYIVQYMYSVGYFSRGWVVENCHETKYDWVPEKFRTEWYIKNHILFNDINRSILGQLEYVLATLKSRKNPPLSFLVMDNVYDILRPLNDNGKIEELVRSFKDYKCTVFIMTQDLKGISHSLKNDIDFYLLFDKKNQEVACDFLSKDIEIPEEKYRALIVNRRDNIISTIKAPVNYPVKALEFKTYDDLKEQYDKTVLSVGALEGNIEHFFLVGDYNEINASHLLFVAEKHLDKFKNAVKEIEEYMTLVRSNDFLPLCNWACHDENGERIAE